MKFGNELRKQIIEILDTTLDASPEDADVYYNGTTDAIQELIQSQNRELVEANKKAYKYLFELITDEPTQEDINWAKKIIKEREKALNQTKGE